MQVQGFKWHMYCCPNIRKILVVSSCSKEDDLEPLFLLIDSKWTCNSTCFRVRYPGRFIWRRGEISGARPPPFDMLYKTWRSLRLLYFNYFRPNMSSCYPTPQQSRILIKLGPCITGHNMYAVGF